MCWFVLALCALQLIGKKKTNSDLVYASAFPRVALVVCFPALSTGCWFPALYWLQVVCFPALGGSCTFLIGLL